MAILVNEKYKKITSAHVDFVDNQVIIFTDNYESKDDRDLEKTILNDRFSFFYNSEKFLTETETAICEGIKQLNEGSLDVENVDAFWQENPELKTRADIITEQRDEYWSLRQKLDNEQINITELTHESLWRSFGLTEQLVRPIRKLGNEGIATPLMQEVNIQNLYGRLKEITNAESIEDC